MPEIRSWRAPVLPTADAEIPWRLGFGNVYCYNPSSDREYVLTNQEFWEICKSDVMNAYERDRNVFLRGEHVRGHWGPSNLSVSGSDTPLTPSRVDFPEIRVNNREAWAKAQLPGSIDIVVSPFQRGYYEIQQTRGSSSLSSVPSTMIGNSLGDLIGQPNGGRYVQYKGRYVDRNTEFVANTAYFSGPLDLTPEELGFNRAALHDFMQGVPEALPVHSDIITECLADANTGMVDLLTTLAETPELIASILNGCKTILRAYKDAKRGELRWYDKVAKLRVQQARLAGIDKPTREHLNRIKQIEKSIVDALDAIAGVWLNYRLNIYPTAKTIEDSIKASDMINEKFIRFRELKRETLSPPPIAGWTISGEMSYEFRCFIKRGAHSSDMIGVLFTSNPFLTAWELVPLSFVVDRYMSIGNLLASLAPRNPKVSDGTTISWKVTNAFTYTHDSGATVSVRPSLYKRNVINPNSYVCLTFPSSRSMNQKLDHLALSWNLFLRNFSRVKS